MLFTTRSDFPDRPRKFFNLLAPTESAPFHVIDQRGSRLSIDKNGAGWLITINYGSIQPKAEDWLNEPIYLGSRINQDVQFEAMIYADNAPNPIRVPMCLYFHTEEVIRTLKELELDHDEVLEKELDELFPDDE